MTEHKGQAEGKNAYHYDADNKSPRRAPQGPLLGSCVNHCRSPTSEGGGKLFIATFGPATSPAINSATSTTAAHRLVAIKAKNVRLGRSFGIFKHLIDNSAQGQRLPRRVHQVIRQQLIRQHLLSQRALPYARPNGLPVYSRVPRRIREATVK